MKNGSFQIEIMISAAHMLGGMLPCEKIEKQDVRVVFSVTRMRFSNSARINKSDFTTEKIV